MSVLPRMRTISAAIAQLRRDDPGTCLTYHALRQMVLRGEIPHARAGAKYLINYDLLLERFSASTPARSAQPEGERIRRIMG